MRRTTFTAPAAKKRGLDSGAGSSGQQQAQQQAGTSADIKPNLNIQKSELASYFECPVCLDHALPPIFQCQAGHLLCSECRPKILSCPTCRGPLGNIRNLAMEKVAQSVFFPCRYSTSGCKALLSYSDKVKHEDTCEVRPYTCPCPGASCKWIGALEAVMNHLVYAHKSITTLNGEDIVFLATDIHLPGAVDWVMMQSCFGQNFMLVLEKQDRGLVQQFYAVVQLIGSRAQTERYSYRLELCGSSSRLAWEATPRSIHEGISTTILTGDCLSFDATTAKHFSENGNLAINVTISLKHQLQSLEAKSIKAECQ